MLAILLLLLPSCFWISHDHHVWPWDQAWYGEVSVHLWFKFTHHLGAWWPAMISAFRIKTPGIAWLGQFFVPLGFWLGSIEAGLLSSVLAAQAGSLVLLCKIGEEFAPKRPWIAVAGVMVVAAAPLFIGLSHQYFVEPLQLFGITYFYLLAAKARKMWRVSLCGHLLLATAIALLAKVTSPIYCLLPGLIAASALVRIQGLTREVSSGGARTKWLWLGAGLILFTGCAAWYHCNSRALRDFVRLSSSSEVALPYGSQNAFLQKLTFWLQAAQINFQLPVVIVGELVLLAVAVAGIRLSSRNKGSWKSALPRQLNLLAAAAVVHIVAVLILFSVNINEENRYLLPLLPAVATVILWCLARAPWSWIPPATALLLGCQWVVVQERALGLRHRSPLISYWVTACDPDREAMSEVLEIVSRTSTARTAEGYNIVGIEMPWLNANTLAFYAEKAQLVSNHRAYYASLGYAQQDAEKAWERIDSLRIHYFISLEEAAQPSPPSLLNQVSIPILRRIRGDAGFVPEPSGSKRQVVLFRRLAATGDQ